MLLLLLLLFIRSTLTLIHREIVLKKNLKTCILLYVTSHSRICPILELGSQKTYPNLIPEWDRVECIPNQNVFLKIRPSCIPIWFGTSQFRIAF